jgi:hypothetical protein
MEDISSKVTRGTLCDMREQENSWTWYIGYIWSQTLKVDDNIIIILFSTSLTFKMYSCCWFYVNYYKSVTYIISGFRIICIWLSSFPIHCLSCAFYICWSQDLFTHITEIPTDNLPVANISCIIKTNLLYVYL